MVTQSNNDNMPSFSIPSSVLNAGVALALLVASLPTLAQPVAAQVETPLLRFTVTSDGVCELWDKKAQVLWRPEAGVKGLGRVTLTVDGKSRIVDLSEGTYEFRENGVVATFHPLVEQPAAAIRVRIRAWPDFRTLDVSYRADEELKIETISLLDSLLNVSDVTEGYVVVPVREGLLIPANSGLAFEQRFDTSAYEGCHMQMLGAVQNGAAVLVTWEDPYVAAHVKSMTNAAPATCRQRLTPWLVLRRSAASFRLHLLGKGDYVQIAKAYRNVAEARGLVVPWKEKLKDHPERAKLFGAANIKLWSTLDRGMNEESTKEESVRLNWTFAEAAQVAEHLKRDLKLDKVLFTIGGWIHRGYDNQHPDILPTAPECGGDAAFADCARRVMDLGYLFCLHDNYQDIYKDSPSWDEKYVMKTGDGKLTRGGHWAGGTAYLTCSKMALELAQRPQNLPAVKALSKANSYFIDTTYASGLQECFDPNHLLTRADDLKWKQALSDYSRAVFGVFGSECGREWAIPHSDFFEGLTGVSGASYSDASLPTRLGATVVPLFDLVYRDCIAMYGKYGYDPYRAGAYVLHHISIGRPLNYHSIPAHLYWEHAGAPEETLAVRPGVAGFKQTAPRQFEISYRWAVEKPPDREWAAFVHFTDRSGAIKFQNDFQPNPATSKWQAGEVLQGPFIVTVPDDVTGPLNLRMGLFRPDTEQRALLQGRENGEHSYLAGRLQVGAEKIEFRPTETAPPADIGAALFTRGENGWTENCHPMDRFIKNTCEILSPLNELTAQMQMSRHEFLTADRKVQRTLFGAGASAVEVVVNGGTRDYVWRSKAGGKVVLPPLGFAIESREFAAFNALSWGGLAYESPAMFTLRSLDGRPLARSHSVRVYHACGPDKLRLHSQQGTVRTEAILK
jgi:hypothetical protein